MDLYSKHIKHVKNSNLSQVYYRQPDGYSCGATCVKMVSLIYNTEQLDIETIKTICNTNPTTGTIETGIIAGLNTLNLPFRRSFGLIPSIDEDISYLQTIFNQKYVYIMRTLLQGVKHWVVVYDQVEPDYYLCLDPSLGIVNYHKDFLLEAHKLRDFDGFEIQLPRVQSLDRFKLNVETINKILKEENLEPYRISEIAGEDGSLCYYYKKNNFLVYLELYSDLDMGFIVSDDVNKIIVLNSDITSIYDFISYMKK
jgi:hypothetical protein